MMLQRCVASALLLQILLGAGPAAAQVGADAAAAEDSEADRRERAASQLFDRGQAKSAEGDFASALSFFTASFDQSPRAVTLYLLADSYEHLGKLQSAHDKFLSAEALADRDAEQEIADAAHTRDAALVPRIPRIEIRVEPSLPARLSVHLNGADVSAASLAKPMGLDAGEYRIDADAPGFEHLSVTVQVVNDGADPTAVHVVSLALVALPPDPQPPAPVPWNTTAAAAEALPSTGEWQRELAYVIGGTGAVVGVVGLVVMGVATSHYHRADPVCGKDNACSTPDGVQTRKDAIHLAHWATAAAVVCPILLAAGASIYFTADESSPLAGAGVSWAGKF